MAIPGLTRLHHAIKTRETENDKTQGSSSNRWSNIDLEPTPPPQRKWSPWYFFAFQFSIAFSPTTYNIGSSLYAIGLNYWTIIIASFLGTFLCCLVLFLNSRGPTWYHVGFPVYVRATAGIYGSLFFIFIRGCVAIFYMGTQTYYASRLLAVALRCVFGHNWTNIPNHLPESAGITTSNMLAFFLTWLCQLPTAWLHPSKAGPMFAVKSFLSPLAYIVTMIWALVKFGGVDLGLGKKTDHGSTLAWAFMKSINTVVSGVVPPMVNIADLARYANKPSDTWPLIAGLFISKPIVIMVGLFTTAAGLKHFGVANWNLWDFYTLILDHYWSPGARTLVFLGAIIQVYATICTNVASNAIPIGADLSGLFPSYFTIIRGQILCSLLIWAVVPWLLVNSASNFLTFLGSYLCFICPIIACMIVDYWVVRRGNYHIPSLYQPNSSSPYYYTKGVNLRAYASWVIGVVLVISGISGAISPGSISQTAVNIYNMGFILSLTAGGTSYFILCKIFPPRIYPTTEDGDDVMGGSKKWEAMVPSEGFFPDDEYVPEYIRERTTVFLAGREDEGVPYGTGSAVGGAEKGYRS